MTTVYQYQANAPCQLVQKPVKQKKSWLWYFCMGQRKNDQESHVKPGFGGEVTTLYVVDPPGRTTFLAQGANPSTANVNTCSTAYSGQYAPQTSVHLSHSGQQARASNFRFEDNFVSGTMLQSSAPSQPSVVIVN